jgi:hypothetical protein
MIHMRIFRVTATRPEVFVRWTKNEKDAHAVRKWLSEADPHASIDTVQFELTEEGVLALLNTIGSSAGGPGGHVDAKWRPIIRRVHYTAAEVTLTPSIERLDALVREIKARDGRTIRQQPAPRGDP